MLPGLNESRCGYKSKRQRNCKVSRNEEWKWRCLGETLSDLVDSNCGAKHCPGRVGGVVGYPGTGKCDIIMLGGVILTTLALLAGRTQSAKLAQIIDNGCWHPLSSEQLAILARPSINGTISPHDLVMRALCLEWLSWGALPLIFSLLALGTHVTLATHEATIGTSTSVTVHHHDITDPSLEAGSCSLSISPSKQYSPSDSSQPNALPRRGLEEPSFYESKMEAKSRRFGDGKGKGKAQAYINDKRKARIERKRKGYDADTEGTSGTSVSPPGTPPLGPLFHSPRHYYGSNGPALFDSFSESAQQSARFRAAAARRERGYAADKESKHSGRDSPSSPMRREKKDAWMNQFAHAPHRPSKTLRIGNRLTRPLSPSWREIGGPSQPFG
jgi:hypothetical protein